MRTRTETTGNALRLRLAATAAFVVLNLATAARAQTVVATANDDPITNVDIEQHEKMLRVLRKPATPQAALDDVIDTRLKLIETSKFKITAGKTEMGWALGFPAKELKMEPQQLANAMMHAGVAQDQIEQKYKADAAWLMYIRALNRTLEVSESDVNAELAKDGGGRAVQYTLRQVIFVLPGGAGGPAVAQRAQAAQALRAKFTSCASGQELVNSTTDAVIQPPLVRTAATLPAQLKTLLDHTEIGHLTAPSRSAEGITMLTLCDKGERKDSDAADTVRNELLTKRLQGVSEEKFAEVKKRAIIVKK